ncbi:MAG: GNAT family N-acetyltransferase [Planctomycetota bacterium]
MNPPWIKDYDASADHHPTAWPDRFDVSRWGLLTATRGEGKRPIGGAVLAFDTPGLEMLEGRSDLAMLWDLRVSPEERGRGAGSTLFAACERWARDRGGIELKIETQDINVPACRFYARQTCVLFEVHHDMYPEHPGETQLIWRKAL